MNRNAGIILGALFAAGFAVLYFSLGRPVGSGAFALVVGVLLLLRAWLPWQRLGLRNSSIAMAGSGGVLIALGVLLLQETELAWRALPLLVVVLSASVLLLAIDRRRHPEAWQRWREAMRGASPVALVLGTHLSRSDGEG